VGIWENVCACLSGWGRSALSLKQLPKYMPAAPAVIERIFMITDWRFLICDLRFPIADLRFPICDCRLCTLPTKLDHRHSAIGDRQSAIPNFIANLKFNTLL